MTKRLVTRSILVAILGIMAGAMSAGTALACGIVVEVLDIASLDPFRSRTDGLKIRSKNETNLLTVELMIPAGETFDWHIHPGWTFASVKSGEIELTRFGKRGCKSEMVDSEGGFFEADGEVHTANNPSPDVDARLLVTFVLRKDARIPEDVTIFVPPPRLRRLTMTMTRRA